MRATALPAAHFTPTLATLRLTDVESAGAKGAVLGELIQARFPVPPGFVVGTPCYHAFSQGGSQIEHALHERVALTLAEFDLDDDEALAAGSQNVRALIEAEPLPGWLAAAVRSAYEALGAQVVAVRPSPILRDPEDAYHAGMFDSFLGVDGAEALLHALRRCWSSLFSPHAIRARERRGLGPEGAELAVVVQAQVPAARAGVVFTLDPATANEDRIVVDAGRGLGVGVVSGAVSADRYVIDKGNLVVVSRVLRANRRAIDEVDGLTAVRGSAPRETPAQVLTDSELALLAGLALRVEEHFGEAQDIEWACDSEGKFWIVQARALGTTASAVREPWGTELVRGLGAAPGRCIGRARVVGSLTRARQLASGEILVAHVTGPESAPLMHGVGAIVTDTGGMSSYAAVVARRLGIPCVVGTAEATNVVSDGQLITVDGDHGLVLRAPALAPAS